MTEQEYNAAEGIRRSALWKLTRSPAHFKYELDNPPEPTPALALGAATHMAILQPDEFWNQYAIRNLDLRTKAGKEERDALQAQGFTILNSEQAAQISGVFEAINNNEAVLRLLAGERETAYFWTDEATGERCKCRTDSEVDISGMHYIVDLKTCTDASTDAFMRDALKYGYHVQAAMYCEGVKHVTGKESQFVFIAVEKTPPYAINILQADDAFMLHGFDEFRRLMGIYHECKTADKWPDYSGANGLTINALSLPKWLKDMVE